MRYASILSVSAFIVIFFLGLFSGSHSWRSENKVVLEDPQEPLRDPGSQQRKPDIEKRPAPPESRSKPLAPASVGAADPLQPPAPPSGRDSQTLTIKEPRINISPARLRTPKGLKRAIRKLGEPLGLSITPTDADLASIIASTGSELDYLEQALADYHATRKTWLSRDADSPFATFRTKKEAEQYVDSTFTDENGHRTRKVAYGSTGSSTLLLVADPSEQGVLYRRLREVSQANDLYCDKLLRLMFTLVSR